MKCELCGQSYKMRARFCSDRCKQVVRLRSLATKQMLDAEERTFGEGYDSQVKRDWIKVKLENISSGMEDSRMYKMFLERNGRSHNG